ncbi:hypothetical protein ACFWJC_27685 [Bacillus wiedmannii]|uniref:hypothetical protein n=1 Tax=Bacillus wiedmannii TaxID=1890302 RepID=UPI0036627385
MFLVCWILLFTYGKYNYTVGDFTPAEVRLTVGLDILQMTLLFMSLVFGLIAYALQEEGGYAGINIIMSLFLFVLTGMSDVLTIYILVTEPVHLQMLFK